MKWQNQVLAIVVVGCCSIRRPLVYWSRPLQIKCHTALAVGSADMTTLSDLLNEFKDFICIHRLTFKVSANHIMINERG